MSEQDRVQQITERLASHSRRATSRLRESLTDPDLFWQEFETTVIEPAAHQLGEDDASERQIRHAEVVIDGLVPALARQVGDSLVTAEAEETEPVERDIDILDLQPVPSEVAIDSLREVLKRICPVYPFCR